jgi:hypothetical protein
MSRGFYESYQHVDQVENVRNWRSGDPSMRFETLATHYQVVSLAWHMLRVWLGQVRPQRRNGDEHHAMGPLGRGSEPAPSDG